MSPKEIAQILRNEMKELKGLKLSITVRDYKVITVKIISFTKPVIAGNEDYLQVNEYRVDEDQRLTTEGRTIFQLINEILDRYHYDRSDAMTDYFDTNFYRYLYLGSWDKPFELKA